LRTNDRRRWSAGSKTLEFRKLLCGSQQRERRPALVIDFCNFVRFRIKSDHCTVGYNDEETSEVSVDRDAARSSGRLFPRASSPGKTRKPASLLTRTTQLP